VRRKAETRKRIKYKQNRILKEIKEGEGERRALTSGKFRMFYFISPPPSSTP